MADVTIDRLELRLSAGTDVDAKRFGGAVGEAIARRLESAFDGAATDLALTEVRVPSVSWRGRPATAEEVAAHVVSAVVAASTEVPT